MTPWIILIVMLLASTSALVTRYFYERTQLIEHAHATSQMVETACGPVQIAVVGEGPLVLSLHGAAGGCDQGLLLGKVLGDVKVIAPSRPGYLRTPLDVGRSHVEQADAIAALLDALGIERVVVSGASGGGPVAAHFALRYPDRCAGVVLISAVSQPISMNPRLEYLARILLSMDFIPWLLMKFSLRRAIEDNGPLPQEVLRDAEKMALLRTLIEAGCTASLRRDGLLNDMRAATDDSSFAFALEAIQVPVFIVHGTADPVVPYAHGEHAAATIPGAEFMSIESGGHLCFVTHREQIVPRLGKFVRECASKS
jgi:pimeloyl-ACP methyl ester carboxylesterase